MGGKAVFPAGIWPSQRVYTGYPILSIGDNNLCGWHAPMMRPTKTLFAKGLQLC